MLCCTTTPHFIKFFFLTIIWNASLLNIDVWIKLVSTHHYKIPNQKVQRKCYIINLLNKYEIGLMNKYKILYYCNKRSQDCISQQQGKHNAKTHWLTPIRKVNNYWLSGKVTSKYNKRPSPISPMRYHYRQSGDITQRMLRHL